MAGIKISALPPVVTPALTDIFPVDQGAVTYKETLQQVMTLFEANIVVTPANFSGTLPVANGGTGISSANPYAVICAGSAATTPFQSLGSLGTAGEQLTSNGPGTLPTWQAGGTVSPLTTKGDLYTYTTVNARLAVGVTNGQILQVNSVAASGLAWSTATFPSTATNAARILRADGTNWVETTSTFADIYAASSFLYANGANNIAGLATANNGLPVTGNTGIPVMLAGPAATGRVLTSNAAAAPSWSTSTFPSVGGTAGNILISDGTNYIASTSLWPNTVGAVGKLLRSDGTTNAYTTSTYPDTNAVSTLLYASSSNVMAALATANNGLLVTSSGGVPSILAGPGTTGNILQSNAAAAPSFSTATYPSVATSTGSMLYANGTNWVASTSLWPNTVGTALKMVSSNGTTNGYTTSTYADTYAINTILYNASANTVTGLATANSSVLVTSGGGVPSWSTTLPAFTTSSITFSPTTGGIVGTTTNDNAAAGKVGEFVSSIVTYASPGSASNAAATNVTSISLTAGDWDLWGNVGWEQSAVGFTLIVAWISTTSATLPNTELRNQFFLAAGAGLSTAKIDAPYIRMSLSGTTTVYLGGRADFTAGTTKVYGGIYARRVR